MEIKFELNAKQEQAFNEVINDPANKAPLKDPNELAKAVFLKTIIQAKQQLNELELKG
jgi:hypothetical protein